jgi:hypothetical protein
MFDEVMCVLTLLAAGVTIAGLWLMFRNATEKLSDIRKRCDKAEDENYRLKMPVFYHANDEPLETLSKDWVDDYTCGLPLKESLKLWQDLLADADVAFKFFVVLVTDKGVFAVRHPKVEELVSTFTTASITVRWPTIKMGQYCTVQEAFEMASDGRVKDISVEGLRDMKPGDELNLSYTRELVY